MDEHLIQKTKSKTDHTYEVIQSLFFMVTFSTCLGVMGSLDSLKTYNINSLLADFFVLIFVIFTYAVNHHMIAYCCRESSEKYNFAEYLEDHFGKAAAMIYDVLMTIHNIVLLSYLQKFVGGYAFAQEVGEVKGNADKIYYFLALINIPLMFISLTSDFKRIKWFCIVYMLTWTYIFTGGLVETVASCTSSQYWSGTHVLSKIGFDSWVIRLIGLQIYFASAFQSLPFIYKEVKKERVMSRVINYSAVATLLVFLSVYVFYTFKTIDLSGIADDSQPTDPGTNSTAPEAGATNTTLVWLDAVEDSPCGKSSGYQTVTQWGLVLAGACAIIVNVIPARFSLAQFLAGNDAETMRKASASDRLLSVVLIMLSIILSLFMSNPTVYNVMVGLGVVLSSFLGIILPPIAFLFTHEYHTLIWPHKSWTVETENKNKHSFIRAQDKTKKILVFSYIAWAAIIGIIGEVGGFFIMFTDSQ
jgi:hypothetical protein